MVVDDRLEVAVDGHEGDGIELGQHAADYLRIGLGGKAVAVESLGLGLVELLYRYNHGGCRQHYLRSARRVREQLGLAERLAQVGCYRDAAPNGIGLVSHALDCRLVGYGKGERRVADAECHPRLLHCFIPSFQHCCQVL